MKLAAALCALVAVSAPPALAGTPEDVRAAYLGFAEAQNARDAERIRSHLTHGADFLWVSAGKSFWGADAVVARMSSFQKAEVWRVEPDLAASTVVSLDGQTAMLHMPLTLVIGKAANPDRLKFLVSILFIREDEWRIAALLTTEERP